MTVISLTVDCELFARGLANALAFIPANSRFVNVWIRLNPESLTMEICGTDGYAAGLSTVPLDRHSDPPERREFLIRKGKADTKVAEGAAGLERTVRMAGKGPCDVSFIDTIVQVEPMGGETLRVALVHAPEMFDYYQQLSEHIGTAEKRSETMPGVVCLDPALWSRFSKVKTDKTGRMADLLFGDSPLDPVLVKIGPAFRGLIMPIDRAVNAKNVGAEGL
ncbi:hypothetical protein QTQ03_02255 [Micromonospora sp. WMMA1363]|uniref:hypothetical protein n=1 Tax=Micromonospora sp. WMMA1363 TaxID=3053985 RepID=UPI00259CBBD0|nr:hypothetical protein [Micromonospora sp. WMMA1363]MDM4718472.1 hypothetical protein [Micromonospora sp. WMMA1363]